LEDRDACVQNSNVGVRAFLRSDGGQNLCFVFLAKKLVKSYIWNIAFDGADIWTLHKVDHKCPESFEMWYWRQLEEIKSTNGVKMEKYCIESRRNVTWCIQ